MRKIIRKKGDTMKTLLIYTALVWFFVIALFLVGVSSALAASDVTLAWDANSEADLAGYKIHYGLASGVYTTLWMSVM